jgi:hypothetical protein
MGSCGGVRMVARGTLTMMGLCCGAAVVDGAMLWYSIIRRDTKKRLMRIHKLSL